MTLIFLAGRVIDLRATLVNLNQMALAFMDYLEMCPHGLKIARM